MKIGKLETKKNMANLETVFYTTSFGETFGLVAGEFQNCTGRSLGIEIINHYVNACVQKRKNIRPKNSSSRTIDNRHA